MPTSAPSSPAPASPDASSPSSPPHAAGFSQPWATAQLTDVTTGEPFTLSGLAAEGKVVFVETMAIWCSNCRAQQREAVAAFANLDPEQFVWVGLDVESSESAEDLARYGQENGFPFKYAIANTDLARALATEFGDVVLSPPSVNLIILGADGGVTKLTGHHSAAELTALAAEHST
jgi:thiol-disulfide isomerase/thioredoxin